MAKPEMDYQQLIDVGLSEDFASFERRLIATADALGFPIISGALMRGVLQDADVQITSLGNTPAGYLEVAKDLGEARRDPVMAKLMTQSVPVVYDQKTYAEPKAIAHPEWGNDRINFNPWPYPTATRLIVEEMNKAVVSGDKTFLANLDPNFVAQDLVEYRFVKNALNKYPDWKKDPSVNPTDPFNRIEELKL